MAVAVEPGWELYRSFLAALRNGSLSGAARALKLTQPTIGRHIDELEKALGTVLFTRSQHGLLQQMPPSSWGRMPKRWRPRPRR